MLKTKDIIKILPFELKFKTKLFAEFDSYNDAIKADIMDVLWSGYCDYYKLRLQNNIQSGLIPRGSEKVNLDRTFYQRMVEKTEKEIKENLNNADPAIDLSSTREELEKIMSQNN